MLLKINYFYILGPLAGLCVLVPYVGVIVSTVPAIIVAFLQAGGREAITVFLLYSALQFLEGNVLTPFIVGGKVRLFPLTVLVAFLFWGTLWGVAGAILAVPLTSAIKVVCENVEGWEPVARLLGEADAPPPPEAI
jgi:predicted PurR-regulated permease PerM